MEKFLDAYLERLRLQFPGFPSSTAHEIASAFLAFKFGLYENAVRECTHAIALIPESGPNAALKKALAIIRANADDRTRSRVTPDLSFAFSPEERRYIAIDLPAEKVEDPGTFELDNALILVYVVALLTSPDDEETMGEHRKLILRLLTDYKKAMGFD
ncbi:MAG: hypothetical protein ABSB80_08350 [Methanoregula sp.]|uniref:hypothetical protein n=1 Tax=Methanoregula sp. TaxID=2052170 RepID=UPI003D0F4B03